MAKTIKAPILALILFVIALGQAVADPAKVVVIPMAGDAASTQYARYAEQTNADNQGCESAVFTTPSAETQVYAVMEGGILVTADESSWFNIVQFKKDGGSWSTPAGQWSGNGGKANTWVQVTNRWILDLSPNAQYQFRTAYLGAPVHAQSLCVMTLTFSAKQRDIVSSAPAAPLSASKSESTQGGVAYTD